MPTSIETNRHSSLDELFRKPGFNEFMSKFDDADEFDISEANSEKVRERYKAFTELPKIKQTLARVITEKIMDPDGIGIKPTDAEFEPVFKELEEQLFIRKDFAVLERLAQQVEKYNQYPKDIAKAKEALAALGNLDSWKSRLVNLNYDAAAKERQINETKRSQEGVIYTKQALDAVKEMDKGTEAAEDKFIVEAEAVFTSYKASLHALEKTQSKLVKVNQACPKPAKFQAQDFAPLRRGLDKAGKDKKKLPEYLENLTNLGMAQKLVDIQKAQRYMAERQVSDLKGLTNRRNVDKKYPGLENSIAQFDALAKEIAGVEINPEGDIILGDLKRDLGQVNQVRQGLAWLKKDPENVDMRQEVKASVRDLSSHSGRELASSLGLGLTQLEASQNKMAEVYVGGADLDAVVKHEAKGRLRKMFSRSPQSRVKGDIRGHEKELANIQEDKLEANETIRKIDFAQREHDRKKGELDMVERSLFAGMSSVDTIFKNARAKKEQLINEQVNNQEDLGKVISARQSMEQLINARLKDPERYGDMDADDADDTTLHGARTLRQLERDYQEILTLRVATAVKKALESLSGEDINPDSLTKKLQSFEDDLGGLAKNPSYLAVKMAALKNLTEAGSGLDRVKKMALKRMLVEGQRSRGAGAGAWSFNNIFQPAY